MKENILKLAEENEMLKNTLEMPENLKNALEKIRIKGHFEVEEISNITFVGMGGSGIIGNIILDWLEHKIPIPIKVWKDYRLPAYIDSRSLVIAISYSGNTEEVLSSVIEAIKRKSNIIAITSNGKLEKLHLKKNFPLIKVPKNFQPREALPYLFIAALYALNQAYKIPTYKKEVKNTIETLEKIKNQIVKEGRQSTAFKIANKIMGKNTIIYAYKPFRGAALRFKQQLNENSKQWAKVEILPEACHNEIVGWSENEQVYQNMKVIMIRDKDELENEVTKARIEAFKEEISRKNIEIIEIKAKGTTTLSRIFSIIYMGDLISILLALLKGIDPKRIEPITRLKNKLKSVGYIDEILKEYLQS